MTMLTNSVPRGWWSYTHGVSNRDLTQEITWSGYRSVPRCVLMYQPLVIYSQPVYLFTRVSNGCGVYRRLSIMSFDPLVLLVYSRVLLPSLPKVEWGKPSRRDQSTKYTNTKNVVPNPYSWVVRRLRWVPFPWTLDLGWLSHFLPPFTHHSGGIIFRSIVDIVNESIKK